MHPLADAQLLVLVTIANGTPVIAKWLLGSRFAPPLDFGLGFVDGRPLLGPSKTVRGVVLAVLATAASAPVVGLEWQTGIVLAAAAMAGDLLSSFVKRRMGLASSSMAVGLDQVPESLLPALACQSVLSLTLADIAACVAIFGVGELVCSRLLFKLRIRDRPY